MHPINGTQPTKLSGKIIILALLFFSCGEKKEINKNKELLSWKNGTPVNAVHIYKDAVATGMNEWRSAYTAPQKKDPVEFHHVDTSEDHYYEYIYPEPQKPWRERIDSCHFFYNRKIDQLLTNRQKTIDRYGHIIYSDYDIIKRNEISKLTAQELLYYGLAHPCSFYQNCNMGGGFPNDGRTYITRDLPTEESARFISPLQEKSLKRIKDSITIILAEGLKDMDIIDLEYLDMAERINLTGLIPVLAPKADLKKNPYIYTLFFNLMNHNDYKHFQHSAYYQKTFEDLSRSGPRGEVQMGQEEANELAEFALKFYHHSHRTL